MPKYQVGDVFRCECGCEGLAVLTILFDQVAYLRGLFYPLENPGTQFMLSDLDKMTKVTHIEGWQPGAQSGLAEV
jgi:hypothetical protein